MQLAPTTPTLIDAVFPGRGLARDAIVIVAFAAFVALFAQIAVQLPFTPVPFTGQTLAVLLTGGALGANRGAASLGLYAIVGSLGLPVFTPKLDASEGSMVHFIVPWEGTGQALWDLTSGGYIVGFVLAAYVVGKLAERGWDRGWHVLLAMVAGNILLYIPGLLWLGYKIDSFDNALVFGLYPFIVTDLMKLYVAAVALPGAWEILGRRRS